MGFVLGAVGAIFFAIASILFRLGQRTRPDDDGHLTSVVTNVVILGAIASVVDWSPWSWPGSVGLAAGGIIGSVFGRYSLLRAIRLIGPTRSNAFITAAPLVTATLGWMILGESLAPVEIVAGALVVTGLLGIVRTDRTMEGPESRAPFTVYVVAAGIPMFFGSAFVVQRWALAQFPGSMTGAFIGVVSAMFVVVVIDTFRGRLGSRIRGNARAFPWHYVGAGALTSAGIMSQFRALELVEAWVVGLLQATQVLWTMVLSVLVLGHEEHITAGLIFNVLLILLGVGGMIAA